jgi:hypothetical protein
MKHHCYGSQAGPEPGIRGRSRTWQRVFIGVSVCLSMRLGLRLWSKPRSTLIAVAMDLPSRILIGFTLTSLYIVGEKTS